MLLSTEPLSRSAHALRESPSPSSFSILCSHYCTARIFSVLYSTSKPISLSPCLANCVTRCKLPRPSLRCLSLSPPLLHQSSQPPLTPLRIKLRIAANTIASAAKS